MEEVHDLTYFELTKGNQRLSMPTNAVAVYRLYLDGNKEQNLLKCPYGVTKAKIWSEQGKLSSLDSVLEIL